MVYDDAYTKRWLAWLAERMGSESVFFPDWMQPGWLPTRAQRWLATTGFGLAVALASGLVAGLAAGLTGGLVAGLVVALVIGVAVARGMGLPDRRSPIRPIEPTRWSWSRARHKLARGLAAGLALGLVLELAVGLAVWREGEPIGGLLVEGLIPVLVIVLVIGVAVGLPSMLVGGYDIRPNMRPAAPLEGIRAAAQAGRSSRMVAGLGIGLPVGVLLGLPVAAVAFSVGPAGQPPPAGWLVALGIVGPGLVIGLAVALGVGLNNGGASYLRHRLLVALLQRQGLIPADLIDFLDYADSRILLRRAGGGYLFVHRLLQDHFAAQAQQHTPHAGIDPAGTSQTGAPAATPMALTSPHRGHRLPWRSARTTPAPDRGARRRRSAACSQRLHCRQVCASGTSRARSTIGLAARLAIRSALGRNDPVPLACQHRRCPGWRGRSDEQPARAAVDALVRPHGNPREVAMRDLEDFLTTTLAVRLRPKKPPQRRPDAMV